MNCPECGSSNVTNYQTCVCRECGIGFIPEDDWISVKVGLPKKPGNYIVAEYWFAYDHTDVRQRTYGGKDYGWYYSDEEGDYERHLQGYRMIAWQYLPEPPKE